MRHKIRPSKSTSSPSVVSILADGTVHSLHVIAFRDPRSEWTSRICNGLVAHFAATSQLTAKRLKVTR